MIGVIGINYKTAPIHIRELFSIEKDQINTLASFLQGYSQIEELVVLSTCNRTELYFYQKGASGEEVSEKLIDLLHKFKAIEKSFAHHFYSHFNTLAVKHLFSVTSGVDSMVFGEYQIVSQVKEAYMHSTENNLNDAILMRLFQKSFETGKKVRTETNIQQGATSVGYLAVEMCRSCMNNIKEKSVLFVGVGETGSLVLQKMKKLGVTDFTFTNRTYSKSLKLAEENHGKAISFEEFTQHLHRYDIIITATNAGKVLITVDDVKNAMQNRGKKQQVYLDLSVPRNIHHGVKANKSVHLIAVDDLQAIINRNTAKRLESRNDAYKIIDQMAKEYKTWFQSRSLHPVILAISENMQKLHEEEIKGYSKCYKGETYEAVNEYASRLTQKYIRTLIKNLREMDEKGQQLGSLDTIKELFIFDSNEE